MKNNKNLQFTIAFIIWIIFILPWFFLPNFYKHYTFLQILYDIGFNFLALVSTFFIIYTFIGILFNKIKMQ